MLPKPIAGLIILEAVINKAVVSIFLSTDILFEFSAPVLTQLCNKIINIANRPIFKRGNTNKSYYDKKIMSIHIQLITTHLS